MRLARTSLGQQYPGQGITASNCGPDPCGWSDYLWVSDNCASWLQCAGQPPVTVSSVLGQGVESITGGAASIVGSGVAGAASSATTDVLIAALLIGAVGVWILFDKL